MNTMPPVVREAERSDLGSVLKLYNAFNKPALALDQFLKLVRATRKREVIFCAAISKKIIGYIIVKTYSDVEEAGMRAEITDFFVSPRARRRGAGRMLLTRAAAFCRQKGAKKIILQTRPYQKRAYKLYQKSGFKKTRIITLHKKL